MLSSALDFEALATRELVSLHLHEGPLGPLPLPLFLPRFFGGLPSHGPHSAI